MLRSGASSRGDWASCRDRQVSRQQAVEVVLAHLQSRRVPPLVIRRRSQPALHRRADALVLLLHLIACREAELHELAVIRVLLTALLVVCVMGLPQGWLPPFLRRTMKPAGAAAALFVLCVGVFDLVVF